MSNIFYYKTPIGRLGIVENDEFITEVRFEREISSDININEEETPILKKASHELKEYFEGKRKIFDLPLNQSGTEFQKKVWKALEEIPYGEISTYKDIAINIGNIKASRAVGMANNKNPIPIFIPCHRVIGSNGKLVGYAGGLNTKEKLLKLEEIKINDKGIVSVISDLK